MTVQPHTGSERSNDPGERVAQVARSSYGKLLAILSARHGDIAKAEDALGDAFARALETWPRDGIPKNPDAWLLTTARNKLRDMAKSAGSRLSVPLDPTDERSPDQIHTMEQIDPNAIPDERLKLLFVCAHPAIDKATRTPLMLQTVLGLEASQIANAFIVAPAAMAQRLVRAKKKIKNARIPFVVPLADEMAGRLEGVLEAVYGAFTLGRTSDHADGAAELRGEALYLADLLVELLPQEPEVLGLAALLNYSAGRAAGASHHARYTPLAEHDTTIWNHRQLARADTLLQRAHTLGQLGRFQIEAAIQGVHSARRHTGDTDWNMIIQLYEGLLHLAPTLGAIIAQAAAIRQVHGAEAGLFALKRIEEKKVAGHQPYWATKAHLLAQSGLSIEACKAYDVAIALTEDDKVRDFLRQQKTGTGHISS